MQILDRYTGKPIKENRLPNNIELGRYALYDGKSFTEITSKTYKVHDGQRIHQELLDDVNKDKHDIFEIISESVKNGDFKSVPLLQGIKSGISFGKFETKLEENLFHIEAIFHSPYAKLNRVIDKVPVSRAKRISNRSNQYLAAHTEDWLHKGLVSFRPSRILTEEFISDKNVYENQLLIALVTKATQYLRRKVKHTRDISQFIDEYNELMNKEQNHIGWYKRVRRELELAGEVYDEEGGNYKAQKDVQIVTSTMKRLKSLIESLSKLRQYDLFNEVDQRLVKTIQYHDTNVLKNDKHYRYLKELWFLLLKESDEDGIENKTDKDEFIINNVRNYGISLINYAVKDKEYLGYDVIGKDTKWLASRYNCPDMQLSIDKSGIILLTIGSNVLKFIVTCGMPYLEKETLPKDTYIIAYDNEDAEDEYIRTPVSNDSVIPVSLRDITSVERIAIVLRKEMLKQYVDNFVLKMYDIPSSLGPFYDIISKNIGCIAINKRESKYTFKNYPIFDFNKKNLEDQILKSDIFKGRKSMEQRRIITNFSNFIDNYNSFAQKLCENMKCFNMDCCQPINRWECEKLSYISCTSCGYILDSTDHKHIKFYKKDSHYSPEEMGMDYLEIRIS